MFGEYSFLLTFALYIMQYNIADTGYFFELLLMFLAFSIIFCKITKISSFDKKSFLL